MEFLNRTLPEETVEYFVHVFPQMNKAGSALSKNTENILREVKRVAFQLSQEYLKGYIWQRDTFKLEIRSTKSGISHLYGCSNFGDSIEDEWLIVWLLRSISFSFPQIWIRITDSMGEFLLVEAANVLPGWLYPDIAENRVWINNGELRIIPVELSEQSLGPLAHRQKSLSLKDVQEHVFYEKQTLHSHLLEDEAFRRIRVYPDQIRRNQHNAMLSIPRKVAFLLHEKPELVCRAVEAIYLRDPIAMKPLMTSDENELKFPPKDLVCMHVKFTRVSYAQMKSQHFEYPPAWNVASGCRDDNRHLPNVQSGMKISCGFEMLMSDPQRQDDNAVREINLFLEDLANGEATLPTDNELQALGTHQDSESWMDINFQDFETQLCGRKAKEGPSDAGRRGFGDETKQENLKHIVQRFESFLNDDTLDGDDFDDDSESANSEAGADIQLEHRSEDEFTKMMMELLEMPENVMQEIMTGEMPTEIAKRFDKRKKDKLSYMKINNKGARPGGGDDERAQLPEETNKLGAAMEGELKRSGTSDILTPTEAETTRDFGRKSQRLQTEGLHEDTESKTGLLNDDYNLIANLMESFKSQGGEAGPGGNLMSLLGVRVSRDEEGNRKEDSLPETRLRQM